MAIKISKDYKVSYNTKRRKCDCGNPIFDVVVDTEEVLGKESTYICTKCNKKYKDLGKLDIYIVKKKVKDGE